jgi:hypothetical protein
MTRRWRNSENGWGENEKPEDRASGTVEGDNHGDDIVSHFSKGDRT